MHLAQTMKDINGRVLDIMECDGCTAYLNYTDLSTDILNPRITEEQAAGSDRFYLAKNVDIDHEVDACASNLRNLLSMSSCARSAMLDFGAGMGYMASAGTRYFEEVIALEPSHEMLASHLQQLPGHIRIRPIVSIDQISNNIDAIIAWHVLEHLPFLLRDFRRLAHALSPGGTIFFQVPLFQYTHLVSCHYTFLNDRASRVLCAASGLEVDRVLFDHDRNFMTCVATKR